MATTLTIRKATRRDAGDIVALFDIAARGLASYLWGRDAMPGQSAAEIGREMVLGKRPGPSYDRAWMAEREGDVVGMVLGYRRDDAVDVSSVPKEIQPIVELENAAPGYWLVNLLAAYPEFRGSGIGARLLAFAEDEARASGSKGLSLIVESDNDGARRLYERTGYRKRDSRPVVPFPGAPAGASFELMLKPFV